MVWMLEYLLCSNITDNFLVFRYTYNFNVFKKHGV